MEGETDFYTNPATNKRNRKEESDNAKEKGINCTGSDYTSNQICRVVRLE